MHARDVVASEVRSLAQRSSTAANAIDALIPASVQTMASGSALAGEARSTMADVTRAVARVTDVVSEIAAASAEQSREIEQVNLTLTQTSQRTQQNAEFVEQAAAASKSLKAQGRELAATRVEQADTRMRNFRSCSRAASHTVCPTPSHTLKTAE